MHYGEVVSRTFGIWWRHKYLWLLGILGGGGGGFGSGFNFPGGGGGGGGRTAPGGQDGSATAAAISTWISDHISLILAGGILLLLIVIALFLLSCVTAGALVEAAAWHDGEQPYSFGRAWRAGLGSFGRVLVLRLIQILVFLVPIAVVAGTFGLGIYLITIHQPVGGFLVAIGVLLGLLLIAWVIVGGVVFELALRGTVLERTGATEGIRIGFRLLRKRLGRLALLWLILFALSIGLAIGLLIVIVVVAIPLVALVAAGYAAGQQAGLVVTAIIAVILGILALWVVGGSVSAISSIYWTLAYRRLDYDVPQPAFAAPYQYPQAPQPGPQPPPAPSS